MSFHNWSKKLIEKALFSFETNLLWVVGLLRTTQEVDSPLLGVGGRGGKPLLGAPRM